LPSWKKSMTTQRIDVFIRLSLYTS